MTPGEQRYQKLVVIRDCILIQQLPRLRIEVQLAQVHFKPHLQQFQVSGLIGEVFISFAIDSAFNFTYEYPPFRIIT